MKNYLVLMLLIMRAGLSFAQEEKYTKFYDERWKHSTEQSAMYRSEIVKKDGLYEVTSYYKASRKLESISTWADTAMTKPRGTAKSYLENGILIDSSFYYNNGKAAYRYSYYNDGQLQAVYRGNEAGEEIEVKGYDESGKLIKGYIFEREAAFPGGQEAWIRFLSKKVNNNIAVKRGAAKGSYQVVVRFIVGKDGNVQDVEAETNKGYGMEEELIRVISKSPKWNNAVQNNKPVNAYRRQPMTFVVQ